jgi:fatty acid synthase subunit alpha, fungi type
MQHSSHISFSWSSWHSQFASPVQWIKTQDLTTGRSRSILCHAKHWKEIYYQFEDEPEAAEATEQTSQVPTPISAPVVRVLAPTPSVEAASVEDVPIKAIEILSVVVVQKLKKKVDEVLLSKTIKDLVGGKSTLQNEILGDLQLEFASAPEKAEESPLEELGSALGVGFTGTLGKYSSSLISRMISGKMPGGFDSSSIKSYLSKTWGLGPSRSDGVLLLGTTLEPAKRFGSEAEARWRYGELRSEVRHISFCW